MTPKEQAKELIYKFKFNPNLINEFGNQSLFDEEAKQCALIAVGEIIKEIKDNYDTLHSSDRKLFWEEVKKEINNLHLY